jgi:hypothetical protein
MAYMDPMGNVNLTYIAIDTHKNSPGRPVSWGDGSGQQFADDIPINDYPPKVKHDN